MDSNPKDNGAIKAFILSRSLGGVVAVPRNLFTPGRVTDHSKTNPITRTTDSPIIRCLGSLCLARNTVRIHRTLTTAGAKPTLRNLFSQ